MAETRAKIAVDAMGGDNAPQEIVAGAIRAAAELDVDILLVGNPEAIKSEIAKHGNTINNIEVIPAECIVSMEEDALVGVILVLKLVVVFDTDKLLILVRICTLEGKDYF